MLAVAVCPSRLVAVTVYVCAPSVEVSSAPGEPDPFESMHESSPGPSVPSAQLKLVATCWPTANTWLFAGEAIDADGAAATV